MGIFNNQEKPELNYEYIKPRLAAKNGKLHVITVRNWDITRTRYPEYVDNLSFAIEEIISRMQDDGYEIIDIKQDLVFGPVTSAGSLYEQLSTLIMYK